MKDHNNLASPGAFKPAKEQPLKVRIWGRYKDKQGRIWKAVEDLKFGRWLLRREDRCAISQTRTRDMIAAGMEWVGQGTSEHVTP